MKRSLSPRPEQLKTMILFFGSFFASLIVSAMA